jgi:hypothetical protein
MKGDRRPEEGRPERTETGGKEEGRPEEDREGGLGGDAV